MILDMKGSKPGLTSIAVINLIHCREWTVVQEPNDEILEPLYPVDINKVIIGKEKIEFRFYFCCFS
jgi:hypothetical protein